MTTATDRSARQQTADHNGRPDRIQALTRDLHADLDYYTDHTNGSERWERTVEDYREAGWEVVAERMGPGMTARGSMRVAESFMRAEQANRSE